MSTIDRTVFLGAGGESEPVWCDEAGDAAIWPEGAVFKVVFTHNVRGEPFELPLVRFFGADGWPLCCPDDLKPRLDPRMRVEFQARAWSAETFDRRSWLFAAKDLDRFRRLNRQAGIIHQLMPVMPAP